MYRYPKTREEWLALRHSYVSSTDSAALFGMSPYLTAFELAVVKKDMVPSDAEAGERAVWGQRLQFAIARSFAEDYGLKVRAMSAYVSKDDVGMGSSFDYEIVGITDKQIADPTMRDMYTEHGPGVLEIKNVDSFIYRNQWTDEEAPAHIEIQGQHQLHCCERSWLVFAALIGGNDLKNLVRLRDVEVGGAIEAKVVNFQKMIKSGFMPPIQLPEDVGIIRKLYAKADSTKVLEIGDDPELVKLLEARGGAAAAEKAAKAVKDSATAQILQRIQDAAIVVGPNGWKISAPTIEATEIQTYTRESYRMLRATPPKVAAPAAADIKAAAGKPRGSRKQNQEPAQ